MNLWIYPTATMQPFMDDSFEKQCHKHLAPFVQLHPEQKYSEAKKCSASAVTQSILECNNVIPVTKKAHVSSLKM